MNKTPLGKTGLNVSSLGFGGSQIGEFSADQEKVVRIVNQLLDAGINCIDTAAGYQRSEEMIGNAISHRRDQFVLVSKCGKNSPNLQGEGWSAAVITQSIDRSLSRLRTDHLDVMLLHGCDLATLKMGEAPGASGYALQRDRPARSNLAGYYRAITRPLSMPPRCPISR